MKEVGQGTGGTYQEPDPATPGDGSNCLHLISAKPWAHLHQQPRVAPPGLALMSLGSAEMENGN